MEDKEKPIIYPPERAITDAINLATMAPIRLFAVLYPLWLVETAGDQEKKQPYELIEHYIERGIRDGNFHTVAELADFFQLNTELVKKVLRFLLTIQHVEETNGRWNLTKRGLTSLTEGMKSTALKKTQLFYFDAFGSQPLLSEHYTKYIQPVPDGDTSTISRRAHGGLQFRRLYTQHLWRPDALNKLRDPDRGKYNVPPESRNLVLIGQSRVYLPMYIIEARQRTYSTVIPHYLVYTHIKGRRDVFFENLINKNSEVKMVLEAEEREKNLYDLWSKWLRTQGLTYLKPELTSNGVWRIVLTRAILESPQVDIPTTRIGQYHTERGYFLHIWCNDETIRRYAVLDYAIQAVKQSQLTIARERIQSILQLRAEKLAVTNITLQELYQRAKELQADEGVLNRLKSWCQSAEAQETTGT